MFYKKVVKCKEDGNLQKEKDVKTRLLLSHPHPGMGKLLLSRKVYHFFSPFCFKSVFNVALPWKSLKRSMMLDIHSK